MNKKLITALVVVVAVLLLAFGPSLLAAAKGTKKAGAPGAMGGAGKTAAASVFTVKTAKAVKKTLQDYIEVNGDIEAETSVDVVPDAAGKLTTLKVQVGSVVEKGQLLAEVDPSKPGAAYSLSPVRAPIAGTVTAAPLSVGATVSTSTTIATVGVMDTLQAAAKIPERDVAELKEGLRATLSLAAFPNDKFVAHVSRVAPVVDSTSRSKEIILKFDAQDGRINAGMFARIKLDTKAYPDRVAVPDEAVTSLNGKVYAYVVSGDSAARREIAVGVSVDGLTEIKSGVAAGEDVVVQGQQLLSDGSKVRVVGGAK